LTGWPSYTPWTGFPFHRLLRLSGLRWIYFNPPPHEVDISLFHKNIMKVVLWLTIAIVVTLIYSLAGEWKMENHWKGQNIMCENTDYFLFNFTILTYLKYIAVGQKIKGLYRLEVAARKG
jgi:hypothetical protein